MTSRLLQPSRPAPAAGALPRAQCRGGAARSCWRGCAAGASVALVSDAGTPAISDPGYKLVRDGAGPGQRRVPDPGPLGRARGPGGLGPADRPLPVPGLPAAPQRRAPARARASWRPCRRPWCCSSRRSGSAEMLADAAAVLGPRAGRGRPRADQAATRSIAAASLAELAAALRGRRAAQGRGRRGDRPARGRRRASWTTPSVDAAAARGAAVGQAARRGRGGRRRHRPDRQRALPPGAGLGAGPTA